MPTYGLTSTGFVAKDGPTITSELQDAFKGVFGATIPLNVNSVFDQVIGILTEPLVEAWEGQQALYFNQFPDGAQGPALSNVGQVTGQTPVAATYSTVTLTLTGTVGTLVPAGSQASVPGTTSVFATTADATIGAGGTVTAAAQATVTGAVAAGAGTITSIVTPVAGWTAVTNAAAAITGLAQETDAAFRARRATQLVVADGGTIAAMANYILKNVAGVTFVAGVENSTDATVGGLPPHSVEMTVVGGTTTAVAQAIWDSKMGGAATVGTNSGTATDSFGNPQTVHWNVGVQVPMYLDVTVTRAADYPVDGDTQVSNALVAYVSGLPAGGTDGVVANWRLVASLGVIIGITGVVIKQDRSPSPTSSANTAMAGNEQPTLSASNIAIH